MGNGNGFQAANEFAPASVAGSDEDPEARATSRERAAGSETVTPTAELAELLNAGQSHDETPALPTLRAEWALWGKDERNTGYHVMRCTKGPLGTEDFREIITRYGSGVKSSLPQYTVYWIPDPQRNPEYLAVAIHELADSGSPSFGGRSRNVAGRVVEYVRLFCFRYAEVAELGASYTELVRAVADIPLEEGSTEPIDVKIPSEFGQPRPSAGERAVAENVAVRLLIGSPVCVLDAESVPVERRLAFIDLVLSLLPFGMRATLSASTSASTTMQDLKLRLYFASAPREDGRTAHVNWDRPGRVSIPPGHEAARLYLEWLRDAGPGAIAALSEATEPVRFNEADELKMLANMPSDKSVAETLAELSGKLRAADQAGVSMINRRLKRSLASQQDPADRAIYRSLIVKHRLFRDQPRVHGNVKASVHRTLLSLGYDMPLSYAAYCDIEESAGGPLSETLRNVLLFSDKPKVVFEVVPLLLVALAGPGLEHDQLWAVLERQGHNSGRLLGILDRGVEDIRPRHRATLIDFTLSGLWRLWNQDSQWTTLANPRAELVGRGYLTGLLVRAFPSDQLAQRDRLEGILVYVHGRPLGRKEIRDIFQAAQLVPSPAFESAVARLGLPRDRRFIEQQAAAARLRRAGHTDDVTKLLQRSERGLPRMTWRSAPDLDHPAPLIPPLVRYVLVFLAGMAIVGLVLLALLRLSGGL